MTAICNPLQAISGVSMTDSCTDALKTGNVLGVIQDKAVVRNG
jgi:hypothetical protein